MTHLESHSPISAVLFLESSASVSGAGRGSFLWWSQYSRTFVRTEDVTLGRGMGVSCIGRSIRQCLLIHIRRQDRKFLAVATKRFLFPSFGITEVIDPPSSIDLMSTDLSATFRSTVKFSSSEVTRITESFLSVADMMADLMFIRKGGKCCMYIDVTRCRALLLQ